MAKVVKIFRVANNFVFKNAGRGEQAAVVLIIALQSEYCKIFIKNLLKDFFIM
jgi:hypothetical protein